MNRSTSRLSLALAIIASLGNASARGQSLHVERSVIVVGDDQWDWTQARTAYVPDRKLCVTTMSRTAKAGAHGYHDVYRVVSHDQGATWSEPVPIPALRRALQDDGYEVVAGDLWPTLHNVSGRILVTGKTFNFADGVKENFLRERVSYAVIQPGSLACGPLELLEMPRLDHDRKPIMAPNAGCHQRVDLSNGDVLLPVRYQRDPKRRVYVSVVAKCQFDGHKLEYLEHGSEHSIPRGRGLYEPSLAELHGEYFLTMRADDDAYVAKGSDGIHFGDHRPWTFDDGKSLGSYHTQQHWVKLKGKLYLVYTRRGANNDHIMRHRAPLFIGQVDPATLSVIRATEQVLVPENHATLGNSGVCVLSDREVWVTVAEGRVTQGKRSGEPNRVILAKITAPSGSRNGPRDE
ncbi:MAG: exo-alpha-sialidase [Planctomycetales bacterium]|nr:exo-alpha-sialidase [Planctomycetales bacterium]